MKIYAKVSALFVADPDDLDPVALRRTRDELTPITQSIEDFQAQLQDIVIDDDDVYTLESKFADDFEDIKSDLYATLDGLTERATLWTSSNHLVAEMNNILAITYSPRATEQYETLKSDCAPFLDSAKSHRKIERFEKRFTDFQNACKVV